MEIDLRDGVARHQHEVVEALIDAVADELIRRDDDDFPRRNRQLRPRVRLVTDKDLIFSYFF